MSGLIRYGAVIGIVGGGQLGRMTALAAASLGYRVHVLSPEPGCPASLVSERTTVASYSDRDALESFAREVDVVTFEFENIPVETLRALEAVRPVRPGARALEVSQDRLREKEFARSLGVRTAPFVPVSNAESLCEGIERIGLPAILKTRRLGYDGKGQARITEKRGAESAWDAIGGAEAILEGFVAFRREISVIVARSASGETATWDAGENVHRDHILHSTTVPASLGEDGQREARRIGIRMAEALDIVGLLAVELFEDADGRLLFNELAPRPHNSGHWTMDGAETSQFEQLVRAICGLPLGATTRRGRVVMENLIGSFDHRWAEDLARAGAHVHLYGKRDARPGRKMGHVTIVESDSG